MTIFDKDRDNEFLLSSKSSALPKLSLKYNPFPRSPSVVIDASNEILNGGLFNPNVRAAKVREFQEKFVDIDFSDPQHLQIGFLWSMSAGEAQKGFGKTALLVYYLRQINKNYGIDLLYKQQVAVTYARPESSTNSLKKLAALVCDSLLRRDPITQKAILTDAIRAIRFKVIQKEKLSPRTLIPLEEPDFETEAGFEQLTESSWVEKKWEMAGYHRVMRDYLVEAGLDEDVAEVLSQYHEKSTFKTSKLMQQKPTEFLFNHVVTLLQAAGFNGLYIFIDDLYVGASGMSERNKDTFADEVRYWFVEGSRSKAARENFFTTIMTFHPDLERSLANSWRKTRLNEMASFDINRSPGNNVVLDPILFK